MSIKNKIDKIKDDKPSKWKENAKYRAENKWLEYSSKIARRILAIIEKKPDLTQARLAVALNVSPQHVSKIVKGYENLTLETIHKLSKVLGEELITFPPYKYSIEKFGEDVPATIIVDQKNVNVQVKNRCLFSRSFSEQEVANCMSGNSMIFRTVLFIDCQQTTMVKEKVQNNISAISSNFQSSNKSMMEYAR